MTVEYEMTLDDWIVFNLYHAAHSPSLRRQMLLIRLGGLVLVTALTLATIYLLDTRAGREEPLSLLAYVTSLIGGIVFFMIYPSLARRSIKQRTAKMLQEGKTELAFGWRELTLTPDDLLARSDQSQSTLQWSAVQKVALAEQHLLIYVSPVTAYIVPRRAFASPADERQFLETIQRYQAASAGRAS